MDNVTVILTPVDAEQFKNFQKYYDYFSIMEEQGVFDIKYGKAILNFAQGILQNVVKEEMVYKR